MRATYFSSKNYVTHNRSIYYYYILGSLFNTIAIPHVFYPPFFYETLQSGVCLQFAFGILNIANF